MFWSLTITILPSTSQGGEFVVNNTESGHAMSSESLIAERSELKHISFFFFLVVSEARLHIQPHVCNQPVAQIVIVGNEC